MDDDDAPQLAPDAYVGSAEVKIGPHMVPFRLSATEAFERLCLPAGAVAALTFTDAEDKPGAMLAMCGGGTGLFAPMDAEALRNFAAQFLGMADEIDGGAGKQ